MFHNFNFSSEQQVQGLNPIDNLWNERKRRVNKRAPMVPEYLEVMPNGPQDCFKLFPIATNWIQINESLTDFDRTR